jgi:NAD(P)-dependent dehydrogenase (short-subunit alcohol dehydrogenase family)
MNRLDGKVAAVTGGGRGLGRAYAMALAAAGASVLVADVGRELAGGEGGQGLAGPANPSVAEQTVKEIADAGGTAAASASDVSTLNGGAAVVDAALEAFGDLHIVVNNAGTWYNTNVEDATDEAIDAEFGVHFKGTVGSSQAALRAMKAAGHGGRIINITSGFGGIPTSGGLAIYCAMKSAVASITLSTAYEGAPFGITANAINPFAVTRQSRIAFVDAGLMDPTDTAVAEHLGPEQNAPLVVFLASDEAAHLTGRIFAINPEGFSADSLLRISEQFVVRTTGVASGSWTLEELQASWDSIVRADATQGTWTARNFRHPTQTAS